MKKSFRILWVCVIINVTVSSILLCQILVEREKRLLLEMDNVLTRTYVRLLIERLGMSTTDLFMGNNVHLTRFYKKEKSRGTKKVRKRTKHTKRKGTKKARKNRKLRRGKTAGDA